MCDSPRKFKPTRPVLGPMFGFSVMSEMGSFLLVIVSVAVPAILSSRRPSIEARKGSCFLTITLLRSLRISPEHSTPSIRSSGSTVGAVMDLADRRPSMWSASTQKISGYAVTNYLAGHKLNHGRDASATPTSAAKGDANPYVIREIEIHHDVSSA